MNSSYEEITKYITEVKEAVNAGRYRIERNKNRLSNLEVYKEYVINEAETKDILMDLSADDFCKILQNEQKGFEHERLYVFGKNVKLLQRFGTGEKNVALYIKFNKLENFFVIVVSFHEQAYPLKYAFK